MLLERDLELERELVGYPQVVLSTLTLVEADRAVRRARRDRRIDSVRERRLRQRLHALERAAHVVALDTEVMRIARRELPAEPVRTLDALHLAAVARWDQDAGDVDVASVDERVRANATRLGFRVVPGATS